jgi:hypothetical protein
MVKKNIKGVVAHMVERYVSNVEARGSIPLYSILFFLFFFFFGCLCLLFAAATSLVWSLMTFSKHGCQQYTKKQKKRMGDGATAWLSFVVQLVSLPIYSPNMMHVPSHVLLVMQEPIFK